jgi:hypothetical protein
MSVTAACCSVIHRVMSCDEPLPPTRAPQRHIPLSSARLIVLITACAGMAESVGQRPTETARQPLARVVCRLLTHLLSYVLKETTRIHDRFEMLWAALGYARCSNVLARRDSGLDQSSASSGSQLDSHMWRMSWHMRSNCSSRAASGPAGTTCSTCQAASAPKRVNRNEVRQRPSVEATMRRKGAAAKVCATARWWAFGGVNHRAEVHSRYDEIAGNSAQVITGRRTLLQGCRPRLES